MNIGFTGTQRGLTEFQKQTLTDIVNSLPLVKCTFNFGMCWGADTEAYHIIKESVRDIKIIGYPGTVTQSTSMKVDVLNPVEKFLIRNRKIVDNSQLLIVCPKNDKEELRSGTWATYRYARKTNTDCIIIIYPTEAIGTSIITS